MESFFKYMVNSDWKNWTIGFQYSSIDDPKYISDRLELFRVNGNGWWWQAPSKDKDRKIYAKNRKRKRREKWLK